MMTRLAWHGGHYGTRRDLGPKVTKNRFPQGQQRRDAGSYQRIIDKTPGCLRLNKPRGLQTGQVVRYMALANAYARDSLTHTERAFFPQSF